MPFSKQTPPVVLSRDPNHADIFVIGEDGRVWTTYWVLGENDNRWHGWFPITDKPEDTSRAVFSKQTPPAVLSRDPNHADIFAIGLDGRVWTTYWVLGENDNRWHPWFPITDRPNDPRHAVFSKQTPPVVLSRDPNHADIFVIGEDGRVWTTYWVLGENDNRWHGWFPITDKPEDTSRAVFSKQTPPAVLSRDPNHADIFAIGLDGRVWTTYWVLGENDNRWHPWFPITDRPNDPRHAVFSKQTPPVVLSRDPNHADIFVIGEDGRVWTTYWVLGENDNRWHGWFPITDKPEDTSRAVFSKQTPPAVLSRDPNHADIFAIGLDGRVWTTYWVLGENDNRWHPWFPITDRPNDPRHAVFSKQTPPVVLSRDPNHADIFVIGEDGRVWTTYWVLGENDNRWHGWFHTDGIVFSGEISSGGLAALGGWAEVAIAGDGAPHWRGHAHDSGVDGYDFGVSAMLSSRTGRVVAFAHHGHVGGTLTPGARDHDWDERRPINSIIAVNYDDFANGDFQLRTDYSSDIGSTLETALSVLTGWVLGSTPLGAAIGLVVFVGVEVGSLISTGSLVPGARVVGGVLWLAGPSNTLLALAAEGIASVGSREREIHADEYDWANAEVFDGTLPERSRLRLTDTIGAGSRAFTFPRFDNKITLNMGPGAFEDPRRYEMSEGRAYGEVFIHELVHAWQIEHTPFDLSLLADALASKICEAGGSSPYTYEAAGPAYSDFNLEQQAQIVSDWFYGRDGRAKDPANSYFRYIAQNIRTGQY